MWQRLTFDTFVLSAAISQRASTGIFFFFFLMTPVTRGLFFICVKQRLSERSGTKGSGRYHKLGAMNHIGNYNTSIIWRILQRSTRLYVGVLSFKSKYLMTVRYPIFFYFYENPCVDPLRQLPKTNDCAANFWRVLININTQQNIFPNSRGQVLLPSCSERKLFKQPTYVYRILTTQCILSSLTKGRLLTVSSIRFWG